MKLHLPVILRKAVLACLAAVAVCTMGSGVAWADNLTLGGENTLTIDYADSTSIQDLNDGALQLKGGSILSLLNAGEGDGKTYTLFTGVSTLLDAEGNAIVLKSSNKAISNYFDTTRPGTGFWADATLQLTDDGSLRLVRHNKTVKKALVVTERQTSPDAYEYYSSLAFKNISYASSGGAISGYNGSTITLSNNGSVSFSRNKSNDEGGAIYAIGSTITLIDNGSVSFSGNTASYSGSAICGKGSTITLSDNGSVSFSGNTAYGPGGAISGYNGSSTITLSNNDSVEFHGNTASDNGGAIYGNTIALSNNGCITFSGNMAFNRNTPSDNGGAISGDEITLSNNDSVTFRGNTATSDGGAIYGNTIALSNNGCITFSGNTAFNRNTAFNKGGAIRGGDITLSNNDSVEFHGNKANDEGGAIYGDSNSAIMLNNNGSVTFSGNTASFNGGAIYGDEITLSNNDSVTFRGNTATRDGGAILGWEITLSDNKSVEFCGNSAANNGGAIDPSDNLSIRNNDSVLFAKNAEITNSTYRLRSIYAGGYRNDISLSAAEGKSIEFRDSVYIASGSTVKLNADYTDAEGVVHKQTGDIIFTGATTEADLLAMKGSAGTADEILNSRTSEVYAMTHLYGGRLRVEDGAVYKGYGITAMEGSAATVRVQNAELYHDRYSLTFNNGTTLELAGTNTITGSVLMLDGSTLSFDASSGISTTKISGSLQLSEQIVYTLNPGNTELGSNAVLLSVSGALSGAQKETQTSGITLTWVNNLLIANYDAATFDRYYNGTASYNFQLSGAIALQHYEGLRLCGNSASYGGAIYGGSNVTLSDNKSVEFSGNTASHGGAIYGGDITLSNNGSVSFSGNSASVYTSDSTYANGGAIYAYGYGNLSIRNNDSVLFAKNAEITNSTYRLRSIYCITGNRGTIYLSAAEGKSIEFRDSVYIASGSTVYLNVNYTDAEGVVHKQAGDIIFTGATTEADLLAMKGSAGTADEILNSRTSEVYAMTHLYGGRLRVEDGAIYKGYGITAVQSSAATVLVKDATLSHAGYELTFDAGTTLAAEGVSNIIGNVVMRKESNLALTVGAANSSAAVLTLGSAMDLQGVHLDLNVTEYLLAGTYKLIDDASYNTDEWSTDVLSISGCSADALAWEDGVLTLKHTWNLVAEDGSAIGDSLGNLEVSGGAEVALHGTLSADADGPGKGHLLIAEGVAHLEQGANVEGDVVFTGTQEAERALVVNTQTAVERVVLDTEPGLSSSISVNADRELTVGTVEGDGVLVKDGAGTLAHTGTSTCEQSSLEVKEGKLQNTGTLAFGQIELKGGHLVNQGTMSSVVMTGGTLSGCGVFDGLEMSGGRLIVGNSPGLQQYTDDLAAEGGELVFCVADLETAATMDVNGWRSEAYSQINMGGNDLLLGENTTLTIALGGSLLEGYDGYFSMVLFTNVGNIGDFDSTAFTLLQNNTQFIITTEADGLLPGWEGGTNVDSWVSNVGYSTSGNNIVLSGNLKTASIPEPTTATLSLLALAALAARRRRK